MPFGHVAFVNHCQIAAPHAVCFDYITDLDHDRDWWPPVTSSQRVSGDGGVGTLYQQTASVGMLKVSSHIEITAYDPHRSMDFTIDSHGHMRCQVRYPFNEQDGITTFPMTSQITFVPLWLKLAAPIFKTLLIRQVTTHFAILKQLLETRFQQPRTA